VWAGLFIGLLAVDDAELLIEGPSAVKIRELSQINPAACPGVHFQPHP